MKTCLRLLQSRALSVGLIVFLAALTTRYWLIANLQERVDARLRALSPIALKDFAPPSVEPQNNGAYCYQAAFELSRAVKMTQPDPGGMKTYYEQNGAEIAATLKGYQLAMRLVEQGNSLSGCRLPIKYDQGFEAQAPNFLGMRGLCRLLALQAYDQVVRGQSQQAVETLTSGFTMLSRLEPQISWILIGEMIHIACQAHLLIPAEEMASRGIHADYRSLLVVLRQLRLEETSGLLHAMQGERALDADVFAKVVNGRFPYHELPTELTLAMSLYQAGGAPMALLDELAMLEAYAAMEGRLQELKPVASLNLPFYALLSQVLMPNWTRAQMQQKKSLDRLETLIVKLEALNTP